MNTNRNSTGNPWEDRYYSKELEYGELLERLSDILDRLQGVVPEGGALPLRPVRRGGVLGGVGWGGRMPRLRMGHGRIRQVGPIKTHCHEN